MTEISNELILACKKRLILMQEEILNRVRSSQFELSAADKMAGDEADQTMAQLAENHFMVSQERLRSMLVEINFALARIDRGTFGICEETQEPIEPARLLAIPYTRYSIEGAEIRDSHHHRYAK